MYPDFDTDAPYKGPTNPNPPKPNQAPKAKKSYFSKEYFLQKMQHLIGYLWNPIEVPSDVSQTLPELVWNIDESARKTAH